MLLEYSVEKPLNREPCPADLVKSFLTKSNVAYDRNHGPLPHINPETHKVRVDGCVNNVLDLSVQELSTAFPQHEVISALQCAGNRRHTMRTEFKEVNGIDWNDGAVMNCTWRGPLLADVLARAGVKRNEGYVAFSCMQTETQDDGYYGSSVCLSRCLDPSMKVILALEMNGRPLNVNHGFPVRVVIPGIAGARWTKWLDRVTVQRQESSCYYQQKDYKILPPHIETKEQAQATWHLVPALQQMPVNSVIVSPGSGSMVSLDKLRDGLEIAGYALPQADDGPVVKVEVSMDRGMNWDAAEIVFPPGEEILTAEGKEKYRWAWSIWRYRMPVEKVRTITKATRIWSRAIDAAGNVQDGQVQWNYRGVGYNGFGEVKNLTIVDSDELSNGVQRMKIDGVRSRV